MRIAPAPASRHSGSVSRCQKLAPAASDASPGSAGVAATSAAGNPAVESRILDAHKEGSYGTFGVRQSEQRGNVRVSCTVVIDGLRVCSAAGQMPQARTCTPHGRGDCCSGISYRRCDIITTPHAARRAVSAAVGLRRSRQRK